MSPTDARTYADHHDTIRRLRGKADEYPCVDCGNSAHHWSYDRRDPNEVIAWQPGHLSWCIWSPDMDRYVPRCRRCRWRHDHPLGGRPQRRSPETTRAEHKALG